MPWAEDRTWEICRTKIGAALNLAGKHVSKGKPAKPPDLRGLPCTGRIVALVLGQGHGFIRIRDGRKVFFHRSDVREGVSFGGLAVDQAVMFELFEDPISGPRALQVQRRRPRS